MTKRMLVDAAYPEETRVVVADNDQLLDFDFESAAKRQLKGNIYLAKVTRVEPSLQAAFVEYGGNRHGFLAFSEIHPDYYQIPQADRDRLAALEGQIGSRSNDEDEDPLDANGDATVDGEAAATEEGSGEGESSDMLAQLRRERAKLLRSYKIQEVIKRRQIMLVQVVKEERGTKGAALTTYLSLAGRYCVLMPNTPRGGGISRKIATQADRSRLKQIAQGLDVPEGMGLIIRTAGQERTKAEIRRDYDYLLRLWSDIRDRTLQSIAPCAIYEEADLIRRAMRDLYQSDIEEILVEGEAGYRTAKAFMTMLMPSRARKVRQYKADTPIFFAHRIEDQLDLMHDSTVRLKSGGSIVINVTEALTAIDVNSGKSTRERHIDDTALKTNLEAADEIARQMRLRDIAGLVVVDFIDMAEHRHERQVEKRFREALKVDRARLQVGRISTFGLLELSRQRLRPSFLELSSQPCTVCNGTGFIRSTDSAALQALRRIEALGVQGKAARVAVTLPVEVALYLLNQKRKELQRIEARYGLDVLVKVDDAMIASQFEAEVLEEASERPPVTEAAPTVVEPIAAVDEPVDDDEADDTEAATERATADGDDGGRRKRRRRRRRRGGRGDGDGVGEEGARDDDGIEADVAETPTVTAPTGDDAVSPVADAPPAVAAEAPAQTDAGEADRDAADQGEAEKPKRRRRRRRPAGETDGAAPGATAEAEPLVIPEPAVVVAATAPSLVEIDGDDAAGEASVVVQIVEADSASSSPEPAPEPMAARTDTTDEAAPEEAPRRQGWWSRWSRGG